MTVINYINASLEIWGSIMSVVVVLCMGFSKRPRERSDRVYLSCLACNVGVLIFDVLALFFRGNPGVLCWWGIRISNYLAYSFGAGLLISFSYYLTEFLDARIPVSCRPLHIIRVVSVLYLLLIVLTKFYPIVYYIDAQNMYHRADLFWLFGTIFFFRQRLCAFRYLSTGLVCRIWQTRFVFLLFFCFCKQSRGAALPNGKTN